MQIVIEIDKARYKDIQRIAEVQLESNHFQTAEQIIAKGVPIEREPKTGHWIMPVQDDGMSDPIYYQVRCSKCGFDLDPQTWHMELHQYGADKYCPMCGFRMIKPQKSEVEE